MIEVGIVMGSNSDWEVMQHAARVLKSFGVACETRVVSAHRTRTCCSSTPKKPRRAA
ncbi:N5-carboxyaminoimidazole ribonucleotide mutase [Chromobacterium violaceum]|uniref:N5-carboxyaminoimidazole ribonucleotide mutase n=1 Tax=Chromobacterium violaceum TaxID=536 RepID=A0A3S4HLV5_CHRVL|nr:N5-carboxyaminoimidazole ribonucleotide mutase [Chromobacterium violaceum]